MRSPRATTKSSPRWPQLEKAHAQQQTPNTAKKKKKKTSDNNNYFFLQGTQIKHFWKSYRISNNTENIHTNLNKTS